MDNRFYLVTFTDDQQMFFVKSAQLEEPPMAEICIPYNGIAVTCYITNKMNWELAIVEAMILKQFFEEKGLPGE